MESSIHPKAAVLLNLGDGIVAHGTVDELRRGAGIDADGIVRTAKAMCGCGAEEA